MTESIFTRPLMRSKLSGEIENVLLKSIIKGDIKAGEKLPTERDLARDLDVNRSTVRAALGKLESLDLIEIRHGDGVYVRDYHTSGNLELLRAMIRLDEDQRMSVISTLLKFRTVIGPEMASLAALNRTDEHLERLRDVIREDNDASILEKDILVHHIIALASSNILYLVLLNFFNKFMVEYGYLYFEDPINAMRSSRFHKDMYQAILARDQKRAREVMEDVLAFAEEVVVKKMGEDKNSGR